MINDRLIRYFFIPLLGIVIPLISGFYHYEAFSFAEMIVANCYSIFISFCVWNGCSWIIFKYRHFFSYHPFIKISLLCFCTVVYGATVATLLGGLWIFFTSPSSTDWQALIRNTETVSVAVIVFTLIYEILFYQMKKKQNIQKQNNLIRL